MPSPYLTTLTLIVPTHAQPIKFATVIIHPHTTASASPPSGPARRRSSPDQHDSQAPARSITTYLPGMDISPVKGPDPKFPFPIDPINAFLWVITFIEDLKKGVQFVWQQSSKVKSYRSWVHDVIFLTASKRVEQRLYIDNIHMYIYI